MWRFYNPNWKRSDGGDCTVRAICKVLGLDWITSYRSLSDFGEIIGDMPSVNRVWGEFLEAHGFSVFLLPNTCPLCYTVKDFCRDNPRGVFVLGTGSHVVAVVDGDYYDAWDSGDKVPVYCFKRTERGY